MALNVGELFATLALNDSEFKSGLASVTQSFDKFKQTTVSGAREMTREQSELYAAMSKEAVAMARDRATKETAAIKSIEQADKNRIELARAMHVVSDSASQRGIASLQALDRAASNIKRDVGTIGGQLAASFADALGDVANISVAISTGGLLGAVTLLSTAIGLASQAWRYFKESAEEAARATAKVAKEQEELLKVSVASHGRSRAGPTESDLGQASDTTNVLRRQKQELEQWIIPLKSELFELRKSGAPIELRIQKQKELDEFVLDLGAKVAELNEANKKLAGVRREMFERGQQAAEASTGRDVAQDLKGQATERKRLNASMAEAYMDVEDQLAEQASALALSTAGEKYREAMRAANGKGLADAWKSMGGELETAHKKYNDEVEAAAKKTKESSDDLVSGIKGVIGAFRSGDFGALFGSDVAKDLASSAMAQASAAAGAGSAAVSAVGQGVSAVGGVGGVTAIAGEAFGAVKEVFAQFAEMLKALGSAVENVFQKSVVDVVKKAFAGLDNEAFSQAGGVAAAFAGVAAAFAPLIVATLALTVVVAAASSTLLLVFAIVAAAAMPLALALGAFASGLFVSMGGLTTLGVGLFSLSTQTKSYADVQSMLKKSMENLVNGLGPVWQNLIPMTVVLYQMTSAFGSLISVFIPGEALARNLFEAFRVLGLETLRVIRGMIEGYNQLNDTWGGADVGLLAVDNAMGALAGLTFDSAQTMSGALLGAAGAANALTDSLTNVPEGFRVAAARYGATDTSGSTSSGGGDPWAWFDRMASERGGSPSPPGLPRFGAW